MAELIACNRNAVAWLCLVSALALHVLDEATSGFLTLYNDTVTRLRENLGFFPAPQFTFASWITGLLVVLAVGYVFVTLVSRGGAFIRVLATAFAALMLVNALGHLGGSLYLGRLLPGFWSSFFLLPAAVWMLRRGFVGNWRRTPRAKIQSGRR